MSLTIKAALEQASIYFEIKGKPYLAISPDKCYKDQIKEAEIRLNERERIAKLLITYAGVCSPDSDCGERGECFDCIMKFLDPPEEGAES